MRSTLSCLVLGLGFLIFNTDGQQGTVGPQPQWDDEILKYFLKISGYYFQDDEHYSSSSDGSDSSNFYIIHCLSSNETNCVCQEGFRKAGKKTTGNVVVYNCERIPSSCKSDIVKERAMMCLNATQQNNLNNNNNILYCSLAEFTLGLLNSICENDSLPVSLELQDTAKSYERLVNSSLLSISAKENTVPAVKMVMEGLSTSALKTALASPDKPVQTVVTNSIVIQTRLINEEDISKNKILRLEAQKDEMTIHSSAVTSVTTTGPVAVAFISLSGLNSLGGGAFLWNETLLSSKMAASVHVNSRVISVSTSRQTRNLFSPVNLTFHHIKEKDPKEKAICVRLSSAGRVDAWTPEGCRILHTNITHSKCSCRYLSSFAVLMATIPNEGGQVLLIISHIGLIISLICLLLSIITFLCCRSIQNSSTFIHLQLSLCLFFADFLFIVGIDKTENKALCSVIAGMLQYLFLACFVWMFLEGINLYLIVKNLKVANYSGATKRVKISMYLCGYGLPIVIVAISAAITPGGYGTQYHCWLNPESSFIWSFLGPVCAIIVVNIVFFCLILKILHEKLASLNSKISSLKNTRSLTFKAMAHLFILGLTWILGLFQFGPMAEAMAYLFTLINSVQGAFIFLVHCLLNRKVREIYWHWICCGRYIRPPVSELSMTTEPSNIPTINMQTISTPQQGAAWEEEPSSEVPPP